MNVRIHLRTFFWLTGNRAEMNLPSWPGDAQ